MNSDARASTALPIAVSNPNRVLWPEEGYTKLDLVEHWRTPFDDPWSGFIQSPPSSSLARSASFSPVIDLAILASMLIDVTCPNTTACENQSVVVGDLQF
jgi:hypothetical protein